MISSPLAPVSLTLSGVSQNELKKISVSFPLGQLTVVTGVSGSGKSSLVWDTLYAECRRHYIDSLSPYIRQFLERLSPPQLESAENLLPAIGLEQRNSVTHAHSTVGTQTEILDCLRLLFAKGGTPVCPDCHEEMQRWTLARLEAWASKWLPGKKACLLVPLPEGLSASELLAQGFARIARLHPSEGFQGLSLLEPTQHPLFEQWKKEDPLFLLLDRFSWYPDLPPSDDQHTSLLDSLKQALSLGKGQLIFWQLDPQGQCVASPSFQTIEPTCPHCGKKAPQLSSPLDFSFQSPLGACPRCRGFGQTLDLDPEKVIPNPTLTLEQGALEPFTKPYTKDWKKKLFLFCEQAQIPTQVPYQSLSPNQKKALWSGSSSFERSIKTGKKQKQPTSFAGVEGCFQELDRWKYQVQTRLFIRRYQTQRLCESCQGSRLKPETRWIQIAGKTLAELTEWPLTQLKTWFHSAVSLSPEQQKILKTVAETLQDRLCFLDTMGLGYLHLSRLTRTLSGGEFQRLRLATQLGQGLCGTLYLLDEPSIGLHPADTHRLLNILFQLRDQGNTIVVVEHDLDVIRAANWLIELGPGAGKQGGSLVAMSSPEDLREHPSSLIAPSLRDPKHTLSPDWLPRQKRPLPTDFLTLRDCHTHNLQHLTVRFPRERFVVVTGVSGSGKSSLVHHTLVPAFEKALHPDFELPPETRYASLEGTEGFSQCITLEQKGLGKNNRSMPATLIKAWDEIRLLFASQPRAQQNKLLANAFSFNAGPGRCPTCEGLGTLTVEMHFMADLSLPCDTCQGKRFQAFISEVTYRDRSIHAILDLTVGEALDFFDPRFGKTATEKKYLEKISQKISFLSQVGLDYLRLGQPSPLLSGGESQRLQIAMSLAVPNRGRTLYVLDEPTQGLHLEDVRRLIPLFQSLVKAGHSLIVVEHHLDLMRHADWIIDLGPGGGTSGGTLVAEGPVETLSNNPLSVTGKFLASS